MTDSSKPIGPFTPTPARILLLVFGALALTYIVGALMGGVANYDELKRAGKAQSPEEALISAAPSQP